MRHKRMVVPMFVPANCYAILALICGKSGRTHIAKYHREKGHPANGTNGTCFGNPMVPPRIESISRVHGSTLVDILPVCKHRDPPVLDQSFDENEHRECKGHECIWQMTRNRGCRWKSYLRPSVSLGEDCYQCLSTSR